LSRTVSCSQEHIEEVGRVVKGGGVVVFPTDTVYGIGCNPYDKAAIEKIYRIKQRDGRKPLPVLARSASDLETVAEFSDTAKKIAQKFWPGQVTLLLGLADRKIGESLGIAEKIAVRVPGGACVSAILQRCGLLVGTSANMSGEEPITDPELVVRRVHGYDILVDGGTIVGRGESTIVDVTSADVRILREGAIRQQEILDAL